MCGPRCAFNGVSCPSSGMKLTSWETGLPSWLKAGYGAVGHPSSLRTGMLKGNTLIVNEFILTLFPGADAGFRVWGGGGGGGGVAPTAPARGYGGAL